MATRTFSTPTSAAAAALTALLLATVPARGQDRPAPAEGGIPPRVMAALEARFPGPVIRAWTRETEDGTVLYDIEFTRNGRKFEADIREDGTIDNWERAIEIAALPAAVRRAVDGRYPRSTLRESMAVTVVENGRDRLEGYEITLVTAGGREVEVTVAPDGKILEDSGAGG